MNRSRSYPSSRAWWIWPILGVYALLLGGWLGLGAWFWENFTDNSRSERITGQIVMVAFLLIAESALLFVPIQYVRRRPITRATIWVPVIATGFFAAALFAGGAWAVLELVWSKEYYDIVLWTAPVLWTIWTVVFYLIARRRGCTAIGLTLHRYLIAGSVLELLIAVPCHLVVRRRTECCAGMHTGTAIGIGITVTLLAFGPSVALLFLKRWQHLRPPGDPDAPGFPVEPTAPATTVVSGPPVSQP